MSYQFLNRKTCKELQLLLKWKDLTLDFKPPNNVTLKYFPDLMCTLPLYWPLFQPNLIMFHTFPFFQHLNCYESYTPLPSELLLLFLPVDILFTQVPIQYYFLYQKFPCFIQQTMVPPFEPPLHFSLYIFFHLFDF